MMATDVRPFTPAALRMSAGIIIWAVHFTVIYGYTGLACARGFNDEAIGWITAVPWVIGIATVLAAALTLVFMVPALRKRQSADFVDWMSAMIAFLALTGIVWEGLTVVWVPICA